MVLHANLGFDLCTHNPRIACTIVRFFSGNTLILTKFIIIYNNVVQNKGERKKKEKARQQENKQHTS